MNKTKPTPAPPRPASRKKRPKSQPVEHEDFITDLIDASGLGGTAAAEAEAKTLGERIRQARNLRGLTVEDLSSRTGISAGKLESVEANQSIPPLGELIRLGKALAMKMGYFISAGIDKPMCVVRADARPKIARRGREASDQYGYVYESLAAEKGNRAMEPFLVTLTPTEFGELSRHDGQEFLFVLEGEISARVGDEIEVLHPGDSIYYDSTVPHLIKCHGKKPARILAVIHAGAR